MTVETIDLNQGLTEEQLDRLIGRRDHLTFLNTRNELYRAMQMKQDPPSRAEAIRLMAAHINLIRRPLLVRGNKILFGFDAAEWEMERNG
jgi:arsenate reductase-like glutaredoxin family protein